MKLLVTRRDASTELLEIAMPVIFSCYDNDRLRMWQMHDAAGTDYFFNKDDGTYDGWGRAVASKEEGETLLRHARNSTSPPKVDVQ